MEAGTSNNRETPRSLRSLPKRAAVWVKSSFSFSNGNCVELAWLEQDNRGLRDSKNPNGGMLSVSPKALKAFLKSIKKGKFN